MSPFITIATVLRARDSSSLTLPMCVMNTINGTFWLVYGLVISDAFIWAAYGSGAVLGAIQLALRLLLPQKAARRCACVRETFDESMCSGLTHVRVVRRSHPYVRVITVQLTLSLDAGQHEAPSPRLQSSVH